MSDITTAIFGAINQRGEYITPNQGDKLLDTYICPICENIVKFNNNPLTERVPYFSHIYRDDGTICENFNKKPTIRHFETLVDCPRFKTAIVNEFTKSIKLSEHIALESKCKNNVNCLDHTRPTLSSEIYHTLDLECQLVLTNITTTVFTLTHHTKPVFNVCFCVGSPQVITAITNNCPVAYQPITQKYIGTKAISDTFIFKPYQDTEYMALHLITHTTECEKCINNFNDFKSVVKDEECLTPLPTYAINRCLNNIPIYTPFNGVKCCILFDLPHFDIIINRQPPILRYELLKYFNYITVYGHLKIDTNLNRRHHPIGGEISIYVTEFIILKHHPIILIKDPNYFDNEYCKNIYIQHNPPLPPSPPHPIIPNTRPTTVVNTRGSASSSHKKCMDCTKRIYGTDTWKIRCIDCHTKYLQKPSTKTCSKCPAKIKDNYNICYKCKMYSEVI